MQYIWILVLFYSQVAWSYEENVENHGSDSANWDSDYQHFSTKLVCKNSKNPQECEATFNLIFQTILSNKVKEAGYYSPVNGHLVYPSPEEIQDTNNLVIHWCETYLTYLPFIDLQECIDSFNPIDQRGIIINADGAIKEFDPNSRLPSKYRSYICLDEKEGLSATTVFAPHLSPELACTIMRYINEMEDVFKK